MPPDTNPLRPVKYTFEVHFKAFIPNTVQRSVNNPWLDEPASTGRDFKTDNRGFFVDGGSARLHSWATFSGERAPDLHSEVGPSHMRWNKINYKWVGGPSIPASRIPGYEREDEDYYYYTATAEKGDGMRETVINHTVSDDDKWVDSDAKFVGEASYPFAALSPDIDYSIRVSCSYTSAHLSVRVTGTHNRFPGYEAYIKYNGSIVDVYGYDPAKHGEMGPGLINLNRTWRVERIRTLALWR